MHIPDTQLARYVAKRCSPEEETRIREWIAADAGRQALVDELTRVWELGALPLERWDVRSAWAELEARRAERRYTIPKPRADGAAAAAARGGFHGWQAPAGSWWARVAAAAIVVLGAGWLWSTTPGSRTPAPAAGQANEYVTRPGQRAELRLADGTRVLLGVDSRIRVPADFGRGARDVFLEGEALFDVRHDPAHPFRVTTVRGVAEDLGTEFVVTAYPEDRDLRVAVISGVVVFRPGAGADTAADTGAAYQLTRGDLAELDSAGTVEVRRGVDLAPYTSWSDGSLVFEATPLADALPRLERWYDVEIGLADSALGARRLTATFHEQPLSDVLDLLSLSFHLAVERRGRTVLLAPKTGAHSR